MLLHQVERTFNQVERACCYTAYILPFFYPTLMRIWYFYLYRHIVTVDTCICSNTLAKLYSKYLTCIQIKPNKYLFIKRTFEILQCVYILFFMYFFLSMVLSCKQQPQMLYKLSKKDADMDIWYILIILSSLYRIPSLHERSSVWYVLISISSLNYSV